MSTSVRPRAAAAAFWRLLYSYSSICPALNLGWAGSAETAAVKPMMATAAWRKDGILNCEVCSVSAVSFVAVAVSVVVSV